MLILLSFILQKTVKRKMHRSLPRARCCPESVVDIWSPFGCNSFASVFGALVQTCTLTQENAATACYCMLLHATSECSVSVSVSHCEATQAESKVFYQKMKARMSVDCVD